MRFLVVTLAFALSLANAASVGNGQIYIINTSDDNKSELSIKGKKLPWIKHPNHSAKKFVIIPAKYTQKDDIIITNGSEKIILKLENQPYKKEQLTVAKNKVNPPKNVLERIKREKQEAEKIYATYTPGLFISKPFVSPLNSKITSSYGSARMYNGTLKSFHGGTDFRAAVGVKITASNDGIVRIAKDRYYAGGSVVIDHGSGIYTQYYHLSKILVKNGDKVKQGDLIALSGASGRVSGPHLHFGVCVNSLQVDPMQFIAHFNKQIFGGK